MPISTAASSGRTSVSMFRQLLCCLFAGCIVTLSPMSLFADGPGQEDLDEATLKKLTAQTMADLEAAIELCDSALEKGLDEENEKYARGLLTATLYEHATRLGRLIFDKRPIDPRWPAARRIALKDLERAIKVDAEMGSAHLLIARLQALPGGDREQAKQAANQAIELMADEPEQVSIALVVRGGLTEQPENMLADFERAIELDPSNMSAWRGRGIYRLNQGEYEKALDDFQTLLETDPKDLTAHQAVAQTLKEMKQFDKAIEHLDQVIETNPSSPIPYALKSQILEENGKIEEAIECLNQAVRVAPRNIASLMSRARLRTTESQFDLAQGDVDRVLQLQPQMPQAILLRSLISAAQGKFDEAIGDLQQLLRRNPDNIDLKVQIATYYEADKQPVKAVELYNEVLASEPEQWVAMRRRGDAYLSMGKQKEAIADYESALQFQPEDSGILNNLAWVLATSPMDDVRNGERSIELAKRACEVTEYKQAHILSTLAAGHAEMGDFDEAVKWSTKAVELDSDERQLARELESYREKKPWREQQSVSEAQEDSDLNDADLDDSILKDAGLEDVELESDEPIQDDATAPLNEAPTSSKDATEIDE